MAARRLRATCQPGAEEWSGRARDLRVGGAGAGRRGLASAGPLAARRRQVVFLFIRRRWVAER